MGCYRQLTSEELGDLERKVAYIEGFRYDPRFGRGPLSVGQLVLRGPNQ